MRRELFSLHLPNHSRFWRTFSRGLSGGDILNICVNATHAGSTDAAPAKWRVTQEMMEREIEPTIFLDITALEATTSPPVLPGLPERAAVEDYIITHALQPMLEDWISQREPGPRYFNNRLATWEPS